MKRLLLPIFYCIASCPASATIQANLLTRQIKFINNGEANLIIYKGKVGVTYRTEDAASFTGIPEGQDQTDPMTDDQFQYYNKIFEKYTADEYANEEKRITENQNNYYSEPDLSSLPVIPSSISRKYLNETSYRYLSMVFTEDEFIPGKPARTIPGRAAYYVPGKPGKLTCKSTGGYQCIDFNRTVCFNNPVQTKCKTVGGSPGYWVPAKAPQYIPAVPARTVTHRRQLTIDCDDQTYDIKNDAKGWKSYWQNSTVSRLAQETCPAISSYPLR